MLLRSQTYNFRHNIDTFWTQGMAIEETDLYYVGFGRADDQKTIGLYCSVYDKIDKRLIKTIRFTDTLAYSAFGYHNYCKRINNDEFDLYYSDGHQLDKRHIIRFNIENDTSYLLKQLSAPDGFFYRFLFGVTPANSKEYVVSSLGIRNEDSGDDMLLTVLDTNYAYEQHVYADSSGLNLYGGPLCVLPNKHISIIAEAQKVVDGNGSDIYLYHVLLDEKYNRKSYKKISDGVDLISARRSLLIVNTNKVIVTCLKKINNPNVYPYTFYIPVVALFDLELEKFTKVQSFGITNSLQFTNNYNALIESHDGNYIYAGNDVAHNFEKEQFIGVGVVGKVDKDLNSIWRHTYSILTYDHFDKSYRDEVRDVLATSDGHYVCYGISSGYESDSLGHTTKSWIFKIDEDGNLVSIDSTSATEAHLIEFPVSVYPNPTSDMLFINQGDIDMLKYSIFDVSGNLIKMTEINFSNHSLIWDISDLTSGNYFLRIENDEGKFESVKIVKI